jgi:hypothetical protein
LEDKRRLGKHKIYLYKNNWFNFTIGVPAYKCLSGVENTGEKEINPTLVALE